MIAQALAIKAFYSGWPLTFDHIIYCSLRVMPWVGEHKEHLGRKHCFRLNESCSMLSLLLEFLQCIQTS